MFHSQSLTTAVDIVSTKPTTEPAANESKFRVQFYMSGVVFWFWNTDLLQWEGANGRPSVSATNPVTATVTPLFVGHEFWCSGESRMYRANSETPGDFTDYGY